jgi:magnesium-transporting ATPase (P-type)
MGISRPTPYVCFAISFHYLPVPVTLLICRFDPPRSDTAQTIAEAGDLGVRVKMLTGDAVAIAKETCRQLALGTNVYDSERLITGDMSGSNVRALSHTEFWGWIILI